MLEQQGQRPGMTPRSNRRGVQAVILPDGPLDSIAARADLPGSRLAAMTALDFVRDHYHEKFPASAIARHCGLSRFQFSRSFHDVYGITFREYLLRYRIRAACDRLLAGDTPVTEIAYAVGFHDGSYFARMFRRYTGVLPSQYARAYEQARD
jgi:AraC-like DNA-binding protein